MSGRLYSIVVLIAVLGLVSGACSTKKAASPPTGNTVQATAQLSFSPVTLNVKSGDTVTWNNSSGIQHNVTFENGAAFSQNLNSGLQISRTFTTAGTFNYYCTIHGKSMHGTIVVA